MKRGSDACRSVLTLSMKATISNSTPRRNKQSYIISLFSCRRTFAVGRLLKPISGSSARWQWLPQNRKIWLRLERILLTPIPRYRALALWSSGHCLVLEHISDKHSWNILNETRKRAKQTFRGKKCGNFWTKMVLMQENTLDRLLGTSIWRWNCAWETVPVFAVR